MIFKSLFSSIILFIIIIIVDIQSRKIFFDEMNEEKDFYIRSFGCNGRNNRNEYRCRLHCQTRGYRNGRCSETSNYQHCLCYKTTKNLSKQQQNPPNDNVTSSLLF